MQISARGQTDIGRVRSTNQDAILVDHALNAYIVCDGMGGHAGGEIASSMCVQKIQDEISHHNFKNCSTFEVFSILEKSVQKASSDIFDRALTQTHLFGMGTTASVVKLIEDHAYIAQVGDSRVYLIRGGFIYQITHDHSLVSEQVVAGTLTLSEAKHHQLRNIITRCVGYKEKEDVDLFDLHIFSGDKFLICSDGLHSKVLDKEISRTLEQKGTDGVTDLIDLANARGGEDNISVVIVAIS